jgi:hypothetical protein
MSMISLKRVIVTEEAGCVEFKNGIWEGLCVDILHMLEHKLQFKAKIDLSNQSYGGMIKAIAAGEADFSINRFYINRFYIDPEREVEVDFIKPLASGYMKALGKLTKNSLANFTEFLHPFTCETWVLFAAFFMCFMLALVFANFSSNSDQNLSQKVERMTRQLSQKTDAPNRKGNQTLITSKNICFD